MDSAPKIATGEDYNATNDVPSPPSVPDSLQEALMDVFRPVLHELDIIVEETRHEYGISYRMVFLVDAVGIA